MTSSSLDGSIQVKSYLMGNPEIRLALNEEFEVKSQSQGRSSENLGYDAVTMDDCNFHDCANLEEFNQNRTISFNPPDGEISLMNYRITGDVRLPFRIEPKVEQQSPYKLEITMTVRADIPDKTAASDVALSCMLPKGTASCSLEMVDSESSPLPRFRRKRNQEALGQTAEYMPLEHKVLWKLKKFDAMTTRVLKCRVMLSTPLPQSADIKREVGPISMNFEIPGHHLSRLQVRHLLVPSMGRRSAAANRWVRYSTQSASYVCRF